MPKGLLALLLSFLTTVPVAAGPTSQPKPPPVKAAAVYVMDADSGDVLFASGADERRPPASMTKMMTLHLLAQAVREGRVKLSDPVPVSEEAYRTGGAQIWLEPGERLPLDQILRSIAIGSANDSCVAVAELLDGSTDAFVARMNEEAKALGMTHTHFANPHGLDDPAHLTTAHDMAVLGRVLLKDDLVMKALAQREDRTIRNGRGGKLWLVNHNRLLWTFPGLIGLKTGYTQKAGYCLTGAARQQGMTMIAVVMGEPSSRDRFADVAALLRWAFLTHDSHVLAKDGQVMGEVSVRHGAAPSIRAVLDGDLRVTTAKGEKPSVKLTPHLPKSVTAPVKAGQKIGTLEVTGDGRSATYRLVAKDSVGRATFGTMFLRLIRGALHVPA